MINIKKKNDSYSLVGVLLCILFIGGILRYYMKIIEVCLVIGIIISLIKIIKSIRENKEIIIPFIIFTASNLMLFSMYYINSIYGQ